MKERKEKEKNRAVKTGKLDKIKMFVQDFEYLDSLGTKTPSGSYSLNVTDIEEEMGKIIAI